MKINIEKNIYNLNLDDLITMASRANNDKRNFLFVSKVLGKHIEVNPNSCRTIGFILASLLCGENNSTSSLVKSISCDDNNIEKYFSDYYEFKEKITVLGFAETATGIGMAVASAIKDSNYLTTTRECIDDLNSILNFEEEHSHATTHKCYLLDEKHLMDSERIVLVDDEITTGRSMLNIIKELKSVTGIKEYSILSVLDWRNKEYLDAYEEFKKKNSVEIDVLSLISGNIENDDTTVFTDSNNAEIRDISNVEEIKAELKHIEYTSNNKIERYIKNTGRFGTDFKSIEEMEVIYVKIAKEINRKIGDNKKVLVLGHGENIYIPSRVASYIKGDVKFKTTTRSPIYCKDEKGYPIKEKHAFYDRGVKYYFYNKVEIESIYDKVVFLTETDLNIKLTNNIEIFKL